MNTRWVKVGEDLRNPELAQSVGSGAGVMRWMGRWLVLTMSLGIAGSALGQTRQAGGTEPRPKSLAPANVATVPVKRFDYSGIGGSVFATGLGEVQVTMHPVTEFLADQFYPYETTVSARLGDKEVALGSNRQRRRSTSVLGTLPRGEIRLVACCLGLSTFESGPGHRNEGGAPRSRVREVQPGVVEVYFETTMEEGKRNDREEQHWYNDVKLTFTGAVTADPGMLFLLEKAQDAKADAGTREAARQALKLASPAMASHLGIP